MNILRLLKHQIFKSNLRGQAGQLSGEVPLGAVLVDGEVGISAQAVLLEVGDQLQVPSAGIEALKSIERSMKINRSIDR